MKSEKNPHVLYPGDWCRPWGSLREHIIGTLLEQRFPLKLAPVADPDREIRPGRFLELLRDSEQLESHVSKEERVRIEPGGWVRFPNAESYGWDRDHLTVDELNTLASNDPRIFLGGVVAVRGGSVAVVIGEGARGLRVDADYLKGIIKVATRRTAGKTPLTDSVGGRHCCLTTHKWERLAIREVWPGTPSDVEPGHVLCLLPGGVVSRPPSKDSVYVRFGDFYDAVFERYRRVLDVRRTGPVSCVPDQFMLTAVLRKAESTGVAVRDRYRKFLVWDPSSRELTTRDSRVGTMAVTQGEFYDELSNPPDVTIGKWPVKFYRGGITVGCTTVGNARVREIADMMKRGCLENGDWCVPGEKARSHIEGLLSEVGRRHLGNTRVVSVKNGLVSGRTDDLAVARALSAGEFISRLTRSIVKHGDLSATVTKECVSVWTDGLTGNASANVPADVVESVVQHLID